MADYEADKTYEANAS